VGAENVKYLQFLVHLMPIVSLAERCWPKKRIWCICFRKHFNL